MPAYSNKVVTEAPFASAARGTGTFNSAPSAQPASFDSAILFVDVTVAAGTSSDVKYQISPDDGTTWFSIAANQLPQMTAVGQYAIGIDEFLGKLYRIQMVHVGSFTSAVWVEFKQ